MPAARVIRWFWNVGLADVALVGCENVTLGESYREYGPDADTAVRSSVTIDSISPNPDLTLKTIREIGEMEWGMRSGWCYSERGSR